MFHAVIYNKIKFLGWSSYFYRMNIECVIYLNQNLYSKLKYILKIYFYMLIRYKYILNINVIHDIDNK